MESTHRFGRIEDVKPLNSAATEKKEIQHPRIRKIPKSPASSGILSAIPLQPSFPVPAGEDPGLFSVPV